MSFGRKVDDWIDDNIGRWFRKTIWDQGGHFLLGAAFAAPAWVCVFMCHQNFAILTLIGLTCSITAATVWEAIQNWGDGWDERPGMKRTLFKIGPVPVNLDLVVDWFFRSAGGITPALVSLAL